MYRISGTNLTVPESLTLLLVWLIALIYLLGKFQCRRAKRMTMSDLNWRWFLFSVVPGTVIAHGTFLLLFLFLLFDMTGTCCKHKMLAAAYYTWISHYLSFSRRTVLIESTASLLRRSESRASSISMPGSSWDALDTSMLCKLYFLSYVSHSFYTCFRWVIFVTWLIRLFG